MSYYLFKTTSLKLLQNPRTLLLTPREQVNLHSTHTVINKLISKETQTKGFTIPNNHFKRLQNLNQRDYQLLVST